MIPPQYVKPFVKRNKTDSADAEAICEAAGRPTMRFVAIKSVEQQSILALHRSRDLLVRQRTKLIQALRGYMGEFGLVAPKGAWNVTLLETMMSDADPIQVPDLLKEIAAVMIAQIRDFDDWVISTIALTSWHRANEVSRRLATILGIGPVTASLISASTLLMLAGSIRTTLRGLDRPCSEGIINRGSAAARWDQQERRSPRCGVCLSSALMRSCVGPAEGDGMPSAWLTALMGRRHPNIVAVAIANKLAWSLGRSCRAEPPSRRRSLKRTDSKEAIGKRSSKSFDLRRTTT